MKSLRRSCFCGPLAVVLLAAVLAALFTEANFDLTVMPAWASASDCKKPVEDAEKRPRKFLLFMNTYRPLGMAKEPIRRVRDAAGKNILDLDPTKNPTRIATEFNDSRIVSISAWTKKPDSIWLSPQSPGTAKLCLEADSGQREFVEIIVLKTALSLPPEGTLPVRLASKKPIQDVEIEDEKVVGVKVDPADPTRAVVKGLAQGFSAVRLINEFGDPETFEIVVYPKKITQSKVLLLSAAFWYGLRMSSKETITQVSNSNEKVLEIRSVGDNPDFISIVALRAGLTKLEVKGDDNSTESFAVFVVDPKK